MNSEQVFAFIEFRFVFSFFFFFLILSVVFSISSPRDPDLFRDFGAVCEFDERRAYRTKQLNGLWSLIA